MRIVIVTVGSFGDVKPLVNLSKELIKKDYHVKIVTFDRFEKYIKDNNIEYGKLSGDVDELMKLIIGDGVNCLQFINNLRKLIKKYIDKIKVDVELHCQNADLILYTYLASFTYHYAEANKIQCIRVSFWPDIKNSDVPLPTFPLLKMGSWYNKLSYNLAHIINRKYTSLYFNKWRKELKLSKWSNKTYRLMNDKPIPTLYAFSELIISKPKAWTENEYITGYWYDNDYAEEMFVPDKGLVDFMQADEKPLYFGFGSMKSEEFDKLQDIIIAALKITNKRAVFAAGWSSLNDKVLPSNIYPVKFVPHQWLFKRVSAVIHHGGAGTTAIGLLEGCPTFIIPFGGDQRFWGTRIFELRLGPKPINRKNLTVKALVKAINFLYREDVVNNAKAISAKLRSENGLEKAIEIIERIIE